MSRQLRPSPHCLNCGQAVGARFCSECGQENTDYHVSLGRLVGDLFEELFQLESRLWRSLWTLFRRPGLLTQEYNAGRRVSYTTPLRLYLIASVTYFFVGSVVAHNKDESNIHFELPEITAADKAKIDQKSPFIAHILERANEAQKDPKAAVQRVRQTLNEWAPRIAAGLVPLFAILTFILFRRPKRFFVEHLVFALHAHATAFLLLTVSELLPWGWVGLGATIALAVLSFMAMRRVFGQSRLRTIWKYLVIGFVYSMALALGVVAVGFMGFLARG
ncbi:MAG: DUF3667 domain-containing protein [Polyangia bacterium]